LCHHGKNTITSVFVRGYKSVSICEICGQKVRYLLNIVSGYGIIPPGFAFGYAVASPHWFGGGPNRKV
jgi:hypothetical protein